MSTTASTELRPGGYDRKIGLQLRGFGQVLAGFLAAACGVKYECQGVVRLGQLGLLVHDGA